MEIDLKIFLSYKMMFSIIYKIYMVTILRLFPHKWTNIFHILILETLTS